MERPRASGGVPGVRGVDHTADVGIEVVAQDLAALFDRAARGLVALLYGEPEDRGSSMPSGGAERPTVGGTASDARESREIAVSADGPDELLARWLREILYLHDVQDFDYRAGEFQRLDERRLRARITGGPGPDSPVREIKGVTYHGLTARREENGRWYARVVFDV